MVPASPLTMKTTLGMFVCLLSIAVTGAQYGWLELTLNLIARSAVLR